MQLEEDLAAFCRSELPRLVGSLSLYTGDSGLAEELAQEALLRACERWKTVASYGSPSAWTHRVAFNLANSAFRRQLVARRVHPRLVTAEVPSGDIDAAERLAIRLAVAALPEALRRALILRYYADLTVNEAADVIGCPPNTVKTHTRRAIELLRAEGLLDQPADGASDDVARGVRHE